MMLHRVYMLVPCLLLNVLFIQANAQNWVDSNDRPIQKQQVNLVLNPTAESATVLAGVDDKDSFWINCVAGKKLPKSNYLTSKFKLDAPVNLIE